MPTGKPAGVRCIQLDDSNACKIFGMPERPIVCSNLRPTQAMCGDNREQALAFLNQLEILTQPRP
jgi:uncharacterized protein